MLSSGRQLKKQEWPGCIPKTPLHMRPNDVSRLRRWYFCLIPLISLMEKYSLPALLMTDVCYKLRKNFPWMNSTNTHKNLCERLEENRNKQTNNCWQHSQLCSTVLTKRHLLPKENQDLRSKMQHREKRPL